jgi:BatD DUF11 like domain
MVRNRSGAERVTARATAQAGVPVPQKPGGTPTLEKACGTDTLERACGTDTPVCASVGKQECRPAIAARSRPRAATAVLTAVLALAAVAARAGELSVDRRTLRSDESVTITVSLEGVFAANDAVNVPVKNLSIEGSPSVSSEFSWMNGAVTRRKVFRFTARPLQSGVAVVGPLVVNGQGGQRETLAAITLEIVADTANASNEPVKILHDLLTSGREPLFVVTEVDRTRAAVGEEVVVTWVLYNAAAVEQWQVGNAPRLDAFWSEEVDVRNEQPERVKVGDFEMERVAVRRVALFPLRAGTLEIGGMEVKAQIMRRSDEGPMSLFEGTVVESGFQSAPVAIEAYALPSPQPDLVGDVTIDCTPPLQKGGGPVTFTATLRGRANLRGVPAPRLEGSPGGELEVQPMPLTVQRAPEGVTMTRKWQYLVFPAHDGTLVVPAASISIYNPRTSAVEVLRCGGSAVRVTQAARPAAQPVRAPLRPPLAWRELLPSGGSIAAVAIAVLLALPRIRSALRARREVRALVAGRTPAAVREAVHAVLHQRGCDVNALATEASDRGDAYRAFRSLVDALDRERFGADDSRDELRRRVRDLLASC